MAQTPPTFSHHSFLLLPEPSTSELQRQSCLYMQTFSVAPETDVSLIQRPLNQTHQHKLHILLLICIDTRWTKWPQRWLDRWPQWFISLPLASYIFAYQLQLKAQIIDVWCVGSVRVWVCDTVNCLLRVNFQIRGGRASTSSLMITKSSLPSHCSSIYLRNLCCFHCCWRWEQQEREARTPNHRSEEHKHLQTC